MFLMSPVVSSRPRNRGRKLELAELRITNVGLGSSHAKNLPSPK